MPLDLNVRCEAALALKRTQGLTLIKDGRILTKHKNKMLRQQILAEVGERSFQVDKESFDKRSHMGPPTMKYTRTVLVSRNRPEVGMLPRGSIHGC